MRTDFFAKPLTLPPYLEALGPNGVARLVAGFAQGIILYGLYRSVDAHAWPSTDPYWMASLTLVFVFVPVLFIQATGTMRTFDLAIWLAGATVLLTGLASHDIWRQWDGSKPNGATSLSFALLFFSAIGMFMAHSIVCAADADRRYIARYSAYFEASWKLGVQLALAFGFVAVFWGVLWLGAILFSLIDLSFIETLTEKSWFAFPATTLATAAAIHLTDVRAGLVASIRVIVLSLLSWLLPLMAVIAFGFTASLPFTGLTPLWATRSAAASLLTAAATLVVLINATYQN